MDNNEVYESELIRDAVRYLRKKDSESKNQHSMFGFKQYYNPWSVEDFRQTWKLSKHVEEISAEVYGVELVVTSDKEYKDPKDRYVLDVGDMIWLQLIPKNMIGHVLRIYKQFKCRIMTVECDELKSIIAYCNEMDEEIRRIFWRTREKRISDVFKKLWVEMGGAAIAESDILGKRIGRFKDMVDMYKVNKSAYEDDMKRLGFLK